MAEEGDDAQQATASQGGTLQINQEPDAPKWMQMNLKELDCDEMNRFKDGMLNEYGTDNGKDVQLLKMGKKNLLDSFSIGKCFDTCK